MKRVKTGNILLITNVKRTFLLDGQIFSCVKIDWFYSSGWVFKKLTLFKNKKKKNLGSEIWRWSFEENWDIFGFTHLQMCNTNTTQTLRWKSIIACVVQSHKERVLIFWSYSLELDQVYRDLLLVFKSQSPQIMQKR